MSHYGVRYIDIPPPTPEEVEEEKLETRKRWAVMMYGAYLDSLSLEDRMSAEWEHCDSHCNCYPGNIDPQTREIYGKCICQRR